MGPYTRIIVALILLAVAVGEVSSRCPPPNWVRGPDCREDHDCPKGVCCPNWLGKKSCVYTFGKYKLNSIGQDYERVKKRQDKSVGAGVYCDGVKCSPWQACKMDPYTRKLRCL